MRTKIKQSINLYLYFEAGNSELGAIISEMFFFVPSSTDIEVFLFIDTGLSEITI